ncbi:hypothetical protein HYC85_018890 [Camellia sinensis]|uniref:Uncharacterized protein n=1 Tax=Camellia sinensis TaxID=4442 RepID=A0A7J7GVJ8_CAMSI|nr:hypothetical protein HYC85_018890 [Camellia sinensis]
MDATHLSSASVIRSLTPATWLASRSLLSLPTSCYHPMVKPTFTAPLAIAPMATSSSISFDEIIANTVDVFGKYCITEYLGLPLVPSYFSGQNGSCMNFQEGVNFAVVGAAALDINFFEQRGIHNPFTNCSMGNQVDWFKKMLPSLCHTPSREPRARFQATKEEDGPRSQHFGVFIVDFGLQSIEDGVQSSKLALILLYQSFRARPNWEIKNAIGPTTRCHVTGGATGGRKQCPFYK